MIEFAMILAALSLAIIATINTVAYFEKKTNQYAIDSLQDSNRVLMENNRIAIEEQTKTRTALEHVQEYLTKANAVLEYKKVKDLDREYAKAMKAQLKKSGIGYTITIAKSAAMKKAEANART